MARLAAYPDVFAKARAGGRLPLPPPARPGHYSPTWNGEHTVASRRRRWHLPTRSRKAGPPGILKRDRLARENVWLLRRKILIPTPSVQRSSLGTALPGKHTPQPSPAPAC